MKKESFLLRHGRELGQKYAGKCIAVINDKIVATGNNRIEVYQKAIEKFPKSKRLGIFYLPRKEELLIALYGIEI